MNLNATVVLSVIGALGGFGSIATLILVFPQIRKLRADARKVDADTDHIEIDSASVLSTASLAQMNAAIRRADAAEEAMQQARRELDRATVQLREASERSDKLQREISEYRAQAQLHIAWDYNCQEALVNAGLRLPEPPALFPKSA